MLYVNTFQVQPDPQGNLQLTCTVTAAGVTTTYNLVKGVTNLSVLYGVKGNAAATGNSADTYMNADQVTAAGFGAASSR